VNSEGYSSYEGSLEEVKSNPGNVFEEGDCNFDRQDINNKKRRG
jgi:hypothetical protein